MSALLFDPLLILAKVKLTKNCKFLFVQSLNYSSSAIKVSCE